MAKNPQCRSAATLTIQVVGYKTLLSKDSVHTLDQIDANNENLIKPKIIQHGGQVLELKEGNLQAKFSDAIEAMTCAIEIRQTLTKNESRLSEHRRINYRFGVNVDDLFWGSGDLCCDQFS